MPKPTTPHSDGPRRIAAHDSFAARQGTSRSPRTRPERAKTFDQGNPTSVQLAVLVEERLQHGPAQQAAQAAGDRQIEPTGIDDANDQRLRVDGPRIAAEGLLHLDELVHLGRIEIAGVDADRGSGFVAHAIVLRRFGAVGKARDPTARRVVKKMEARALRSPSIGFTCQASWQGSFVAGFIAAVNLVHLPGKLAGVTVTVSGQCLRLAFRRRGRGGGLGGLARRLAAAAFSAESLGRRVLGRLNPRLLAQPPFHSASTAGLRRSRQASGCRCSLIFRSS